LATHERCHSHRSSHDAIRSLATSSNGPGREDQGFIELIHFEHNGTLGVEMGFPRCVSTFNHAGKCSSSSIKVDKNSTAQ